MATRILVCDDHPVFRGGLAAALEAEDDLEVVGEVGSIAELREGLAAGSPDLVLLDVDLPDGSGDTVVAEVAGQAHVVMLSAHDQPNLVRRAMQDGAVGYIRKDAEPTELLRLVRRAAEGKTALSGDMALRLADSLRRDPDERAFDEALASLSPRQRGRGPHRRRPLQPRDRRRAVHQRGHGQELRDAHPRGHGRGRPHQAGRPARAPRDATVRRRWPG